MSFPLQMPGLDLSRYRYDYDNFHIWLPSSFHLPFTIPSEKSPNSATTKTFPTFRVGEKLLCNCWTSLPASYKRNRCMWSSHCSRQLIILVLLGKTFVKLRLVKKRSLGVPDTSSLCNTLLQF